MKNIKYYLFLLICLLTTVNVYAADANTESTQDSTLSTGMLIFAVVIILAGTIGLIMHFKNKAQREEETNAVNKMKENLRNSVENGLNGPYANNNMNNNMYNNSNMNNNYYNNQRR